MPRRRRVPHRRKAAHAANASTSPGTPASASSHAATHGHRHGAHRCRAPCRSRGCRAARRGSCVPFPPFVVSHAATCAPSAGAPTSNAGRPPRSTQRSAARRERTSGACRPGSQRESPQHARREVGGRRARERELASHLARERALEHRRARRRRRPARASATGRAARASARGAGQRVGVVVLMVEHRAPALVFRRCSRDRRMRGVEVERRRIVGEARRRGKPACDRRLQRDPLRERVDRPDRESRGCSVRCQPRRASCARTSRASPRVRRSCGCSADRSCRARPRAARRSRGRAFRRPPCA